jgi:hypothetical protein
MFRAACYPNLNQPPFKTELLFTRCCQKKAEINSSIPGTEKQGMKVLKVIFFRSLLLKSAKLYKEICDEY